MFTSPLHYKQRALRSTSVLSPFLRHLNTSTLAFLLFVALAVLSTIRGKEPANRELAPGPVSPGQLGSLMVYSATDAFEDGGVPYYAHSSYAIYTTDGKLFKNVENHISRSDEIPEAVALPVGIYTVLARSEKEGYIRVPVVIKADQQTILDLDPGEQEAPRRLAHR
jgi:hypothetical protein